jgi:hypothetical protein
MRIFKLDTKKLQRVCNPCCTEMKGQRVYGARRQSSSGLEEVIRAALALGSVLTGRSRSGSQASQQSMDAAAQPASSASPRPASPGTKSVPDSPPESPRSGALAGGGEPSVVSVHSQSAIEIDI